MKIKTINILLLLFLISFVACKRKPKPINEGELIYKITYIQNKTHNRLIALLPKTIRIDFKGNKTAAIVEGFWGTFQLKFINLPKKQKSYTVLRLMDKKYYAENSIDSINAGYSDFKVCNLKKYPKDTLSFAGLLSHSAYMYCKEMGDSAIKIYYTNDLKIKDANSNTPYKAIDGVLTKFQTKVAGIDMIFELIELKKTPIDNSEFIIPKDYKKLSKKDLNELLLSFQQ